MAVTPLSTCHAECMCIAPWRADASDHRADAPPTNMLAASTMNDLLKSGFCRNCQRSCMQHSHITSIQQHPVASSNFACSMRLSTDCKAPSHGVSRVAGDAGPLRESHWADALFPFNPACLVLQVVSQPAAGCQASAATVPGRVGPSLALRSCS